MDILLIVSLFIKHEVEDQHCQQTEITQTCLNIDVVKQQWSEIFHSLSFPLTRKAKGNPPIS